MLGTVDEYNNVKPMGGDTDGAGLTVRLIRVSDGVVVATQSDRMSSFSNLSSPEKLMRGAADRFQKAVAEFGKKKK